MRLIASRLHFPRTITVAVAAAVVLSGCVLSQTGPTRLVRDESAVFTGTLRSVAAGHTEYWFEYGTSTAYDVSSAHTGVQVVSGANEVSSVVDGLTAGTVYHYRLCNDIVADDVTAPTCGADTTVTTGVGRVSVTGSFTVSYPEYLGGRTRSGSSIPRPSTPSPIQ